MARPRYTVHRSAWRIWEAMEGVPHLLTDVVDALEALPPGQVEVRRILRPPAVLHEVTGTVFGRRFLVTGNRDAEGRWLEVLSVEVL